MEVLFSYKRSHPVSLPAVVPETGRDLDIRYLIKWLLENILSDKNRPDLFAQGESV